MLGLGLDVRLRVRRLAPAHFLPSSPYPYPLPVMAGERPWPNPTPNPNPNQVSVLGAIGFTMCLLLTEVSMPAALQVS